MCPTAAGGGAAGSWVLHREETELSQSCADSSRVDAFSESSPLLGPLGDAAIF